VFDCDFGILCYLGGDSNNIVSIAGVIWRDDWESRREVVNIGHGDRFAVMPSRMDSVDSLREVLDKKRGPSAYERCRQYFERDVSIIDSTFMAFVIDVSGDCETRESLNDFLGRVKVEMDRLGTIKSDIDLMRKIASNEYKRIANRQGSASIRF
jgi:hypothetical protein